MNRETTQQTRIRSGFPTRKASACALALMWLSAVSGDLSAVGGQGFTWGGNIAGELGEGSVLWSAVPVEVDTTGALVSKTVTQISTGIASCGVTSDGGAYCWGSGQSGQLGNGSTGSSSVPVAVDTTGVLAGKMVTQISANWTHHTCAVTSDGGAYCWGGNGSGQLGSGGTDGSSVPVAVDTTGVLAGKTVTQISVGSGYMGGHACAVTADGGAYCWGENGSGQLGNGGTDGSSVPVAVNASGVLSGKAVTQISAGFVHTCAVTSDGGAYCWGRGLEGQLGNGSTDGSNVPVAVNTTGVLSGKAVAQISAGFFSACAVTSDGGAYCWGRGLEGQLGNGSTDGSNVPVAVNTTGVLSGKTVTQISAGSSSCAVTSAGGAYCWGANSSGAVGDGSTDGSSIPVAVDTSGVLSGKAVAQISVGGATCAVTLDGKAYCWGSGQSGQLGNGSTTQSSVPVSIDTSGVLFGKTVAQISAGSSHTCAVTSAGGAYCWGSGQSGQLGNGSTAQSSVAVAVDTSGLLSDKVVKQVSTGGSHTCAVTSDGGAYCWGGGGGVWHNMLGNGSSGGSSIPVAVDTTGVLSGKTVVQISAGGNHTCVVTSDGGAYCWGSSQSGQLGNGSFGGSSVPVAVDTTGVLSGKVVTQISAGSDHIGGLTCAVTADGGAYCWGRGFEGQLGNGSADGSNVPVAVNTTGALSGKTVTQISAGKDYACAVTLDGGAYCWGANLSGTLGNGNSGGFSVPVAVETTGVLSGKTVVHISTGGSHACAVTLDGGAFCWGENGNGKLGNGSTGSSSVPVAVDMNGVLARHTAVQISAGGSHTAALAFDCPYTDHLDLGSAESISSGTDVWRACETITLLDGYTVGSAGEVLLEARKRVSFQPGVSVQAGGRLRVRVGALPAPFRLEGSVVNAPVANATVTVFPQTGPLTALATTNTTADGTFAADLPQDAPFWVRSQGGTLNGASYTGELWGWCPSLTGCLVTPWSTVQYQLVHEYGYTVENAAVLMEEPGFTADPFVDSEQTFDLAAARTVIGQGSGLTGWVGGVAAWLQDPAEPAPAGWDYPLATLILEGLTVTEGREFDWEVSIDAPVSPIVDIEWEQLSGVPVTILEGTTATLWADAPFVAEPEPVEMRVRATDDRGGVVTATGTVNVHPYQPNYVGLVPVVSLPPGLLLDPNGPFDFTTVSGDTLEIADDVERPMLVLADDADGLALLSIANATGGLLGEAQGTVEFSIDSTALVLAVLTAGEAIPSLTTERVADIRGLEAFAELVDAIESLLGADKNFLQRMGQYADLQTLVDLTAENFPPLVEPAATESLSTLPLSPLSSFASTQFNQGYGELKDGFYCTPLIRWPCSPWNADQAWNWFGTAQGAEVFSPDSVTDWVWYFGSAGSYVALHYPELLAEATLTPFLAYSEEDRSLHALANPNFINHAMEAYSGSDFVFWNLAPRNSTMIQKLRNSGAAMRTERAGYERRLSPSIDRIRFQGYRGALSSVPNIPIDHAGWVSLLNQMHLAVASASVLTDFQEISGFLESVDAGTNAIDCAQEVFDTIDIYLDPGAQNFQQQVEDFLNANIMSILETVLSANSCTQLASEGGKTVAQALGMTGLRAKLDTLLTIKTFGIKIGWDVANQAAPVWTSFLGGASGIDYYLTWNEWGGQPYISRVTTTQLPRADFRVAQLAGTTIRLDGSTSSHDPSTSLSYNWYIVSDFQGSDGQFMGTGETLEATFPTPGEYIVELEVVDGAGSVDYQRSPVTVRAGRLPSIDALQCSITDNQLNMRLSIDDPDGRVESIRWFADTTAQTPDLVTTPATAEVNLSVIPADGGNWARVEIPVSDSEVLRRSCWTEARSPGGLILDRYEVIGADGGIIRDVEMGLEWMRCSLGQTWTGSTCSGSTSTHTFDGAQTAAQALNAGGGYGGYTDWRVPSIEELQTLVYCSSGSPAYFKNSDASCSGSYDRPTIVSEAFPNTPSSYFWSGSPRASSTDFAWGVSFRHGFASDDLQSGDGRVRLVRGGQ